MNYPRIYDSQTEELEIKDVTIQEDRVAEDKEEEEELGWKNICREKAQIEKKRKQLLKMYVDYRKTLLLSLKEFCAETETNFNTTKLQKGQQIAENIKKRVSDIREQKQEDVNEKTALVEKVLAERRIKKYYKSKYHVDFHDQLDPEDDQEQLYQFYYQIFAKYQGAPDDMPTTPFMSGQHATQFMPGQYTLRPSRVVYNSQQRNRQTGAFDQYLINFPIESIPTRGQDSFDQMNMLPVPGQPHPGPHLNQSFIRVASDISFDRNQQQNTHVNMMDLHLNFQDVLNSSKRYDTEQEVKDDKKEESYQDFINKQKEHLMMQKLKVKELTEKAYRVLNNEQLEDELKDQEQPQEESIAAQFRYLLSQLIQIFTVGECLKHTLKFKSYELIHKIYQHASQYYGEEIIFEEPLTVKYMSQIIQALLPQQPQKGIKIVIENIFSSKQQIQFESFVDKLTSCINEKEYQIIEGSLIDVVNTNILDLAIRMFNIWIELDYFQHQVKDVLIKNKQVVQKFVQQTAHDSTFNCNFLHQYIYKTKKVNKIKRLKIQIFFRHIVGHRMKVSEFYRWFQVIKISNNQSFRQIKEKEQLDYYYNFY